LQPSGALTWFPLVMVIDCELDEYTAEAPVSGGLSAESGKLPSPVPLMLMVSAYAPVRHKAIPIPSPKILVFIVFCLPYS
jgi:hypothetical protein